MGSIFRPQFADVDGDGHADLMTGSNCCDWADLYWVPAAEGKFSAMRKVKMKFAEGLTPQIGKAWPIAKVIDWNRDGFNDVLVFHKIDSENDVVSISYGGADVDRLESNWSFEPLFADLPKYVGFEALAVDIADFDGDGNFDIVCGIRHREKGQRPHSRIVLLKNESAAGPPKFSVPEPLYDTPPGWLVDSIRVGGLGDGSGELVVGVSKARGNKADAQLVSLIIAE